MRFLDTADVAVDRISRNVYIDKVERNQVTIFAPDLGTCYAVVTKKRNRMEAWLRFWRHWDDPGTTWLRSGYATA